MHAPVLVTAPADTPVSLAEAKLHLRVDHEVEDTLITVLLKAATGHLDGWTGILGRCLVEQKWQQDFDRFEREMRLPLYPVAEVESLTWRNEEGQIATVAESNYALKVDALGPYVRFVDGYSYPSGLYRTGAVSVTFSAGYPQIEGASTVPAPLKAAILLLVGHWYQNREAVVEGSLIELPMAVNALIAPYRRTGL